MNTGSKNSLKNAPMILATVCALLMVLTLAGVEMELRKAQAASPKTLTVYFTDSVNGAPVLEATYGAMVKHGDNYTFYIEPGNLR